MNRGTIQQAELLSTFQRALSDDPQASPPAGLDPDLAETASSVARHLHTDGPDPLFRERLIRRLHDTSIAVTRKQVAGSAKAPRLGLRLGWGAAVCSLVVVVAVALAIVWLAQPKTVSATAILEKARNVSGVAPDGTVQPFVMTEKLHVAPRNDDTGDANLIAISGELRVWYGGSNRWRRETNIQMTLADSSPIRMDGTLVSDGTNTYDYDHSENQVTIHSLSQWTGQGLRALLWYDPVGSMADRMQSLGQCGDAVVRGSADVAGRDTYVVEIPQFTCHFPTVGRQMVWVDKETYFILKMEEYDSTDGSLVWQNEAVDVQYDADLDSELFTFELPSGAEVLDLR